jgi:hypothetical protein
VIALALASGIAPSVWAEEGERAIITAFHLMEDRDRDGAEEQMSG